MEDWMPPGPSPETVFSSTLADVVGSNRRSCESESIFSFLNSEQYFTSLTPNAKDGLQADSNTTIYQTTKHGTMPEQNASSRGSLLERMANRAGFRPVDLSQNLEVQSPYLIIPPGLSPTILLESPVFLSNSLAQPYPTTGTFLFLPNDGSQSSASSTSLPDLFKEDFFRDMNASSFALVPTTESGAHYFGVPNKITPTTLLQPSFPCIQASAQPENESFVQSLEHSKSSTLNQQVDLFRSPTEQDTGGSNMLIGASLEQSPGLDEQQDSDIDQRGNGDPKIVGASAEDGYSFRKYGQKKVKGSVHPRSYYKCSYLDCPVKKKVGKSAEGDLSEIVYKGEHNHPKPLPGQKPTLGSWRVLDKQDSGSGGDTVWKHDNVEVTSLPALGPDYGNRGTSLQEQNGSQPELGSDVVDGSSTFSHEENDDHITHGSVSLDCDAEGDESESKRRKTETHAAFMSAVNRPMREPRVIVQTISEVDILDDGYRWRKYGQKVVKGNPNPRSYYKCTSAGCFVRKHVERASHDLKSVITTYEGKHNHEVPTPRNSCHNNLGVSRNIPSQSTAVIQNQLQRNEPHQVHGSMAQFERNPPLSSFVQSARPPLGPYQNYGYGFDPRGFSNLAMGGLQPNQGQLPVHQFLRQHNGAMNAESLMLPQVEPKVEPLLGSPSTLPNSSSIYHQVMSMMQM